MAVNKVAGYPDLTGGGTSKYIGQIYSKQTILKWLDEAIAPAITMQQLAKDLINAGDTIYITTDPDPTVSDYTINMEVDWELLETPAVTMTIDYAEYVAFRYDKISLKQFFTDKLGQATTKSSQKLAIATDVKLLNNVAGSADAANKGNSAGRKFAGYPIGVTGTPAVINKTVVLDYITHCDSVAGEQNWPKSDRWIAIPQVMSNLISRSDLRNASLSGDGKTTLKNGYMGQLGNMNIYNTNLYTTVSDGGLTCYNILFGHKEAITFINQLQEMENHEKFERTFGRGMKGLHVYGFKVTKPEALGVLYATFTV